MKTTTKVGGGLSLAAVAIISSVISLEGGFTTDPRDRGNWTTGVIGQGELKGTNYGISAMAYPSVDIKNLTKDQATYIYVTDYINRPGYSEIINLSHVVGQKVVDAGVNAGTARSSRWFQSALNAYNLGGKSYPIITVDGKVGPGTVAAFANLQRIRGKVKACELVLKAMDAQQGYHYLTVSNSSTYAVGWFDHRIGNVPVERCKEDK